MPAGFVRIGSAEGLELPCWLAMPEGSGRVPAVVLASTIRGIDEDLIAIAGEFAQRGYIAAAPDLFARAEARPIAMEDARSRVERIQRGERDMVDTLAHLRTLPAFNGRAAVMGFCYGGPYAIIGPKRLGYAAGIACHGSNMLEFAGQLDGVDRPVCITWGDDDERAPADVLSTYRELSSRTKNLEVHVLKGVRHGYMLPKSRGFDANARDLSMDRALAILATLRTYEAQRRARYAERPGFRISELQISPSQSVPWHFHSRTQDVLYVIEGTLLVHLLEPPEHLRLEPGDTLTIRSRRPHHVTNGGDQPATFLVLQGIGEVDFVPLAHAGA